MFDEISLKESITYIAEKNNVEDLEDLSRLYGKSKFLVNHTNVLMVPDLKANWKQSVDYLVCFFHLDALISVF